MPANVNLSKEEWSSVLPEWQTGFGAAVIQLPNGRIVYCGWRSGSSEGLEEFYDGTYHAHKMGDTLGTEPNPGEHCERDARCMEAVGVDGKDLLVVGCGCGNNLTVLKNRFRPASVSGCEVSYWAVRYCRRWFPDVDIRKCRAEELSSEYGGEFDVLLALDLTEHLPFDAYLFFLFEAFKVLRPGGRLAVLPGCSYRNEHINILPVSLIAMHMEKVGFEIVDRTEEWVIGSRALPVGGEA